MCHITVAEVIKRPRPSLGRHWRKEEGPRPPEAHPPKMIEDRRPGWEIARQVPPGTASAQDVENGIQDGAQGMGT